MKNNIFSISITIFFGLFIFYIGCDDTTTNIDNKQIPSSNVSFGQHIFPVFESKCNYSGCHDDAAKAGGISLTTYVGVTDPNVVLVGDKDPQDSPLVQSIEGLSGAYPMPPPGYTPLTDNQINGIKTWIKEGAKNN